MIETNKGQRVRIIAENPWNMIFYGKTSYKVGEVGTVVFESHGAWEGGLSRVNFGDRELWIWNGRLEPVQEDK